MKSESLFPKQSLPGSVHMEWKCCGRSWCHCSRGHLHGPYFYRRWREDGLQKKRYVKVTNLRETLAAIEMRKHELPPVSDIKASLRRVVC